MSTESIQKVGVTSPLGDEALVFKSLVGTEQLGRLFEYELTALSEDPEVDFNRVLGEGITVELLHDDGSSRHFHGYISCFTQCSEHDEISENRRMYGYRATLVPWFWFLTRTSDCRVFQNMSVPEIIETVFGDLGFSDYELSLDEEYPELEYCTQYRETAFDFVSRLMERSGIYYYFEHHDGRHVMVLGDSDTAHQRISFEGGELAYRPEREPRTQGHLTGWNIRHDVRSGTYESLDFDFLDPSGDQLARKAIPQDHPRADAEVFDYPGNTIGVGEPHAQVRIEELQSMRETVTAWTGNRYLAAGYTFQLTEHPRSDQCREYLVVGTRIAILPLEEEDEPTSKAEPVRIAGGVTVPSPQPAKSAVQGESGWSYRCDLTAIDARQPFRAPSITPLPRIRGPQTAIVVGPDNEEIWTDEHGRVKVQFHWDRRGERDENSSCWVRVSENWAGGGWGQLHVPRIGQEVIVEFLEGEPDRPIITGRVYNAEQTPPYDLPDAATQSGVKTRSTPDGTEENFNELRFEDKKDEEEIYFHAERDFTRIVENDDVLKVGFEKQDPGDQTIEIYNNRTTTLQEGDDELTVSNGKQTIYVKKDITIEAGDQITLKTGQSEIILKKDGTITIKGKDISIKGLGSFKAEANSGAEVKSSSTLKLEGMQTTVKGLQLDLAGDAMAKLKGGVTMIG